MNTDQSDRKRERHSTELPQNPQLGTDDDPQIYFIVKPIGYIWSSPKFIRAPVYSCTTYWLRPRNSLLTRILAHIRGRHWSFKIDDISV
jgi:hypothetical protein